MFSVKGEEGKQALDRWISWARRCRIPVFVELAGGIVRHRQAIDAALDHGLWQGLIESTHTKIRLLTRIAFGFRSPEALIAWPCSPSAAAAPPYRAEPNTHGSVSRAGKPGISLPVGRCNALLSMSRWKTWASRPGCPGLLGHDLLGGVTYRL